MNFPELVGLHVKKNGKLPSNESISEVVKKCKNKRPFHIRVDIAESERRGEVIYYKISRINFLKNKVSLDMKDFDFS